MPRVVGFVAGEVALLQGDANGDGVGGFGDYVNWQHAFGTHLSAADFDHSGTVDSGDYIVWSKYLGSGTRATANASAPEPATLLQIILVAAILSICRRRGG